MMLLCQQIDWLSMPSHAPAVVPAALVLLYRCLVLLLPLLTLIAGRSILPLPPSMPDSLLCVMRLKDACFRDSMNWMMR